MRQNLSRPERRRMKRHADRIATLMAANQLRADGGTEIPDPVACGVLRRAFAALVRNGCAPVVLPLTEPEARALPGFCPTPPGASWWIAAGLDVDGRATWVSRFARVTGLSETEARDVIEVRMLRDLAAACNVRGFVPAGGTA